MGKLLIVTIACLLLAACAQPSDQVARVASRTWHYEDGTTRSLMLTVSEDGRADLFTRGPARSVPHWGELEYPEELAFGKIRRLGDRTFLVFAGENLRVLEIAERGGDHLAVWLYAVAFAVEPADEDLLALPGAARAPDLDLTLLPEQKRETPADPTTRFAI